MLETITTKRLCNFEECEKTATTKGLCGSHYNQQHAGKPLKPLRARRTAVYTKDGLKVCRTCGEAKNPIEGFYKMSGSNCRKCHGDQCKDYRSDKKDFIKEIRIAWRKENEGHRYVEETSGYENWIGFNHPIANPSGITRYHRIVLFDKIGPGEHPCFHCGKLVTWETSYPSNLNGLVVDHLDWDKSNNHPDNLVPSCNSCNVSSARRKPKTLPHLTSSI